VDLLFDILVAFGILWVLMVALFLVLRPKGGDFAATVKLLPDMAVLFGRLSGDKTLPWHVRLRPLLWAVWAVIPITYLIFGVLDEVVLGLWVIRSMARRAGPEVLERHWQGSPEGLAFLKRVAGLPEVTL
jgi:hypothetical protein